MGERLNRLNAGRMFRVMGLVEKEYAAAGLDDGAFAAKVGEQLGFPVAKSSIAYARKELGIPSTAEVRKEAADGTVMARIERLEATILALTKRVQDLEANSRSRPFHLASGG